VAVSASQPAADLLGVPATLHTRAVAAAARRLRIEPELPARLAAQAGAPRT
jgi:hypothetical protein